MPLSLCRSGNDLEVIKVLGGMGIVRKLSEIGIYPGVRIFIVNNSYYGPILIALNSIRVALGRGIAAKIIVKPLN
ncbi:MAG: FeoA family protein [Ignavibacterium sp.]|uniref:FeoA family protein n=1 Tax=Ignavibacterium sp. TaxID=2651167 RepID=UPI0040498CBB